MWMMAGQMPLTRTIRNNGQYTADKDTGYGHKTSSRKNNPSYQDQLFQQTALALGPSIEPMEMVEDIDHEVRQHWNMLRLFPENPVWEFREKHLKDKYGPYSEYLWRADDTQKSLKYNRNGQPVLPSGFKLVMRYQPPSDISKSGMAGHSDYRYFLN